MAILAIRRSLILSREGGRERGRDRRREGEGERERGRGREERRERGRERWKGKGRGVREGEGGKEREREDERGKERPRDNHSPHSPVLFLQVHLQTECAYTLTLAGLDTEALLGLSQHQLLESSGGLCREVRGRRSLQMSKHLLLEQLECAGRTLE